MKKGRTYWEIQQQPPPPQPHTNIPFCNNYVLTRANFSVGILLELTRHKSGSVRAAGTPKEVVVREKKPDSVLALTSPFLCPSLPAPPSQPIAYEGQNKNPEMCRVLLTHEVMCR